MFTPGLSHWINFSISAVFSTRKGTLYAQLLPEITLYEALGDGVMESTADAVETLKINARRTDRAKEKGRPRELHQDVSSVGRLSARPIGASGQFNAGDRFATDGVYRSPRRS